MLSLVSVKAVIRDKVRIRAVTQLQRQDCSVASAEEALQLSIVALLEFKIFVIFSSEIDLPPW